MRKTSALVYRRIEAEGLLSERRFEAYSILYRHGPLTSNEIFEYSKLKGLLNYRHNTNARMTELRDLGVVEEVDEKKCSVTGELVILWDVTDRLPEKKKNTRDMMVKKVLRARQRYIKAIKELRALS